ncbi:hypothetical protein BES34_015970 [Leptospira inadai serovar Lyme]|uniref:Uncharacterized protein n=1 Tax=Leptospira inadai serovar Lyme TaxID=293084 RepID=A0ABX4YFM3_9LEPT|nr:hypothetical protein BES34_015970 [Leptospira inadai serovar Lyme]
MSFKSRIDSNIFNPIISEIQARRSSLLFQNKTIFKIASTETSLSVKRLPVFKRPGEIARRYSIFLKSPGLKSFCKYSLVS